MHKAAETEKQKRMIKMKKFAKATLFVTSIILILAVSGCGQSTSAQPATVTPGLSVESIKNTEYQSELAGNKKVKLVNGTYEEASAPNSASKTNVVLVDSMTAFGDLNSDGIGDAVAILASNGGGSGTFIDLAAVLNQGGKPNHVASVKLGDRVKVEAISVSSGTIVLNYLKQGPNDPLANPTQKTTEKYKLQGDKLVKVD